MWISRIRVTGGFLKGLDLSLSNGLNVIVGPRGAGKTTLLELVRHALGAQHADQVNARKRREFLDAVLGAGEIILDLESDDGGRHLVVDAKGGGQRSDLSDSALVLGQNELEEIASDAPSRLNLLDLRMGEPFNLSDREHSIALTADLKGLREQLLTRREEAGKRKRLEEDRNLFASQEAALLGAGSERLVAQREQLKTAEEAALLAAREAEQLQRAILDSASVSAAQEQQTERLADLRRRVLELRPGAGDHSDTIDKALQLSRDIGSRIDALTEQFGREVTEARGRNFVAREMAAPIREELETAEAGLGQITAQLRNIDAELRVLEENDVEIAALGKKYEALLKQRDSILDEADSVDEKLFAARSEIARETTAQISNGVVVVVDHLADSTAFRTFLQDALRGSGTRAALIDAVVEGVIPRQLLEFAEAGDAASLSAVAQVPEDRANRFLDQLIDSGRLPELAQVALSDSVDFRLRDGAVEKSVDVLSTGQKCAVTLPIVLSEQNRTLILDQPEDHLDNAYLVANVVGGLDSRRRTGAQTIVATHNANIPVLGSADMVVVLASDGTNGSVAAAASFDDNTIVSTITGLMEGGREAFAYRSRFYAEHVPES